MTYKERFKTAIAAEEQELTRLANEFTAKTDAYHARNVARFSLLRAYLLEAFGDLDASSIRVKIEDCTARFQLLDQGSAKTSYVVEPNNDRLKLARPGYLIKIEKDPSTSTKHYDEPEMQVQPDEASVMEYLISALSRHVAEQKDLKRRASAYFALKWPSESQNK